MVKRKGCGPGDKVHVLIEEFGATPQDVQVFCKESDAQKAYNKFIKENFGSKRNFNRMHGETDKSDIYWFTPTLDFNPRRIKNG